MEIENICKEYESSTKVFLDVVNSLSTVDLDKRAEDGWSARQVIHHLADSEAQSYARLRRLLAEPEGTTIQGYDEGAWAESPLLGYNELPIENSLAVFASVRAASLDILRRMSSSDLNRKGVHTESGEYSVNKWVTTYTNHPREHSEQIAAAIGRK
ncbi:MAG: hypothetical protein RLZZ330_583 [Actinomycetota bacterium]|jgi:hypothetical protein